MVASFFHALHVTQSVGVFPGSGDLGQGGSQRLYSARADFVCYLTADVGAVALR